MYGLDNASGVNVMPKIAPVGSASPLWFTEGGAGLAASYPGQDWFNMIQAELLGVLTAGEIKPDKAKLTQLAEAIKKIASNADFQPPGNYLKVGDGGWMKDTGVSLSGIKKLSDYRINSIGYAYASVSTDTFKSTNNIISNLFGYLNNKYGVQLAVTPNVDGDFGYRVVSNDIVGEWIELAKKAYVDNGLSKKFDKDNVTQDTGASTTKVISQKAITELVNDRYTKEQTDTLLSGKMSPGAGGWMVNRGVALSGSSKLADYRLNSIGYAWNTVSSDLFLGVNNLFFNLFGFTDSSYGAQLAVVPSVGSERIGFRAIQSNNVGSWVELATRKYVDDVTLGKNQKYYVDDKSTGVTYTNTSQSAIFIAVTIKQTEVGGQANIHAHVDGGLVCSQSCYAKDTYASANFLVPAGSSYKVEKSGNASVSNWRELR